MVENRLRRFIGISAIVIACIVLLYPILMMVNISFKSSAEMIVSPLALTTKLHFENYVTAIREMNYWRTLMNSLIITGASASIGTFLYTLSAYAIVRAKVFQKFFSGIFIFFWLGLALPAQIAIVPLVMWMQKLHLGGSMVGIIFVFIATNAAYGVFFFSGFIATVPISLEEAANIDGATPFQTFRHIVFPLLKTPMVTLTIIMVLRVYNNFIFPLVLLQGPESRTLPLTIYFFKGDRAIEWNVMFAATTLVVIPLMIIYFVFQRKIQDGMMSGSVKM